MIQQILLTWLFGVMINMGVFDNASSVVIDNKVVSSIVTGDGGVLYQKTGATYLSIDVPLNLVYSDAFNITGYLKDSTNTGLGGKTVKLKVGSTIVDSTTTTTGGAYSFTETPVSTGNHTFQVVFEGYGEYDASLSSTVSRNIGKETTVVSVTVDKQKYDVGETATATIVLTDDDGNPLNGATVNYTLGSTQSTTTTNSSGRATVTFTVQSSVTSISCAYPTDSNYSASSDSESFSVVTPTVLALTSATPVIESGDSVTVNVSLLDQDGDAIGNASVSYSINHGGTVISSGSVTTDSNGSGSVSYTGTGVGDVTISATCSDLTETYTIEDCVLYRTQEYSYLKTSNDNYNQIMNNNIEFSLPTDFELTFDYKTTGASSSNEHRFFIQPKSQFVTNTQPTDAFFVGNLDCGTGEIGVRRSGTQSVRLSGLTCNVFHTWKISRQNTNNLSFYLDGLYRDYYSLTSLNNTSDLTFAFHLWANGTVTVKNIKLKAL